MTLPFSLLGTRFSGVIKAWDINIFLDQRHFGPVYIEWDIKIVARLAARTKLISCWSRTDVVGAWRCQSAYEDVRRGCRRISTRSAELPRRMLILSYAIWFARDQCARAPRWAPTVDKRCSAVLRGVSHEGRLIGRGAHDKNWMVTQVAETAI